MRVTKLINNNLVHSENENGEDVIVFGCGIGFKTHIGDVVDKDKIDKIYVGSTSETKNKLELLVQRIPYEHISVCNEIIQYAKDTLGKTLDDNIYIGITDHVNFAIERFYTNTAVKNGLLWEIQEFYRQEYAIGIKALDIIEKRLGIRLPEDEAGFLALHVVNNETSPEMNNTIAEAKMLFGIINIIKYEYKINIGKKNSSYGQFVSTLKFFLKGFLEKKPAGDTDEIYSILAQKWPSEARCVEKIKKYCEVGFGFVLSGEDKAFLAFQIRRLIQSEHGV